MLDDREQRVLDATAVVLGREEPELATRLRTHSIPARRARARRIPLAVWPPLIMIVICLVLVILPALLR